MDKTSVRNLVDRALARSITFPEILATLSKEGVESYQVDFLRNECRWYASNGESFVAQIPFVHGGVSREFSVEALENINRKVSSGKAAYPDFVTEGAAAGCAGYTVYLSGKKVRYFGRDGGEHIQHFPGSKP